MSQETEGANARFLPEVEEALRRAGWYPGRQVEEEVLEKWYAFKWAEIAGFCRIFPAAYRFLREFGGLTLRRGNNAWLLDPLSAVGYCEASVPRTEWQFETRLYPLSVENTGEVLFIDLQGRFWFPSSPVLMGHNIEEALANLLIPGRLWSHPPEKVNGKPIDQATHQLLDRIDKAEEKVASS